MVWLAVDKNGDEFIYTEEPFRRMNKFSLWSIDDEIIELPKGSIEKLTGKKLTWEDEPVEI